MEFGPLRVKWQFDEGYHEKLLPPLRLPAFFLRPSLTKCRSGAVASDSPKVLSLDSTRIISMALIRTKRFQPNVLYLPRIPETDFLHLDMVDVLIHICRMTHNNVFAKCVHLLCSC